MKSSTQKPLETLQARFFEKNDKLPAGGFPPPKNADFGQSAEVKTTYVSSGRLSFYIVNAATPKNKVAGRLPAIGGGLDNGRLLLCRAAYRKLDAPVFRRLGLPAGAGPRPAPMFDNDN